MNKTYQLLDSIPTANSLRIKLEQKDDDRLRAQTEIVKAAIENAQRVVPQDGVIVLEDRFAVTAPLHERLHSRLTGLGYSIGTRQVDNTGATAITLSFKTPVITYRGQPLPGVRD